MSDKQGWTPGPLRVAVTSDGFISIGGPNMEVLGGEIRNTTADVWKLADADLYAAAPALYAALDELLNKPQFRVSIGGNPNAVDAWLAQARAALLQAHPEGGQTNG